MMKHLKSGAISLSKHIVYCIFILIMWSIIYTCMLPCIALWLFTGMSTIGPLTSKLFVLDDKIKEWVHE